MSDDIVQRLRDESTTVWRTKVQEVLIEAADEIERLREQNATLQRNVDRQLAEIIDHRIETWRLWIEVDELTQEAKDLAAELAEWVTIGDERAVPQIFAPTFTWRNQ